MKIALIVLGIFAAINLLLIVMPQRCLLRIVMPRRFPRCPKGKDAGEPSKGDR